MKRISPASLAVALVALSAAPHAATLGVSMALFDDNFLTAVRASMKERAQPIAGKMVRVIVSRLRGKANLLGAARLAWGLARKSQKS